MENTKNSIQHFQQNGNKLIFKIEHFYLKRWSSQNWEPHKHSGLGMIDFGHFLNLLKQKNKNNKEGEKKYILLWMPSAIRSQETST